MDDALASAPWHAKPPRLDHLVVYQSVPTSPPSEPFIVDLRCPFQTRIFYRRPHPLFPVGAK